MVVACQPGWQSGGSRLPASYGMSEMLAWMGRQEEHTDLGSRSSLSLVHGVLPSMCRVHFPPVPVQVSKFGAGTMHLWKYEQCPAFDLLVIR
eukprot:3085250-Amphidinium_carterae.1